MSWSAILVTGFALLGCAQTATIEPRYTAPAESESIPLSVGVFYSPEFRDYQVTTKSPSTSFDLVLPIGEASVSLLQDLLPEIFDTVEEVGDHPLPSLPPHRLDAVIEPEIEDFTLRSLRVGKWRYWAEIRYRLTVRDSDGAVRTSWTVRGAGTNAQEPVLSGPMLGPEETVEGALKAVAEALVASFDEVPEAARWRRGQALDGTTAPAAHHTTQYEPATPRDRVRGAYPDVVAVALDPNKAPDPTAEGIDADLPTAGASSFYLTVENLGDRRLLVQPSAVKLALADGSTTRSVPGSYLAAVLTRKQLRWDLIQPSAAPGIAGAITNLVIAFKNYGAFESEASEATVYRLVYETDELGDTILDRAEKVEGFVHFRTPPEVPATEQARLIVPVVALDAATRYVVSLPLGSSDPKAMQ